MTDDLLALDESIRREADEMLEGRGLRAILADCGTVHVTGSYALHLMTWRGLDVYIETESIAIPAFVEMGGRIAELLTPVRMNYRDWRTDTPPDRPAALYWGIYLGDERAGAWKLDVYAMGAEMCRRRGLDHCAAIAARLTPETHDAILRIKSQCWQHPEYRRTFTSQDIYRAVLDAGVRDVEGFRAYLPERDLP